MGTAVHQRPLSPAKCALFSVCVALPFLYFCAQSYLNYRPIETTTLLALYFSAIGLVIGCQTRLRSAIFLEGRELRRWAQCGGAGFFLGGALVFFIRPMVLQLAVAPPQFIWMGIVVCLQWLLPFFLVMYAALASLLRFRKRTGRPMFNYSIVDIWAAIVGLAPVMLLANVRFDPEILIWIFLSQMCGIFAGKALMETYCQKQNTYASPLSILAGATVGLAAVCVPIQYLFTRNLTL